MDNRLHQDDVPGELRIWLYTEILAAAQRAVSTFPNAMDMDRRMYHFFGGITQAMLSQDDSDEVWDTLRGDRARYVK